MKKVLGTVFVGLSGGVDSSVSAALLKEAGFDVTGVFMKVWQPDWIECTWKDDRRDAMRVAAHLGIPFVTLDLEKEYKEGVIDYMIAEYKAGRTPNPDVMCNREVKFGAFWKWAKSQGADFIATGHYAQVSMDQTETLSNNEKPEFRYSLLKGADSNKDQSYFLWTLNQDDLAHVLFPVGNIPKPEVRKLAAKFKLPNALKKDSQGLCFIGKIDIKQFLQHYIPAQKGDVINDDGKVIGSHPGALLFTNGERHGFSIDIKTPSDRPYYVIAKDVEKNTLTVSNKVISNKDSAQEETEAGSISKGDSRIEHLPHGTDQVVLNRLSWVNEAPVISKSGFTLLARSRYRQQLEKIWVEQIGNDTCLVRFEKMQESLTPGQSLVIYDGEKCLGGGVIE